MYIGPTSMAKETPPEAKTGCYTDHHDNNNNNNNNHNHNHNHNHSGDNDNDRDLESSSSHSSSRVSGLETCRVCQCLESDKRGDTALEFLGIAPPSLDPEKGARESSFTELVSPDGEVLVIKDDPETGPGPLIELGCSCKNDLALVHYSCALKWFLNHGSTVCEICGLVAKNVRASDLRKVVCALKEHEALRERAGEPSPARVRARQRLSEVSLWFGPNNNNNTNVVAVSLGVSEQSSSSMNVVAGEEVAAGPPSTATKWAVEGTGILLATGLLTVTLAGVIAPRVGKKTARIGLHILLGGFCALAIVVFFRFFVLTRIKYGPARYWAILFVFWFLVFGIWASRTHGSHHSS